MKTGKDIFEVVFFARGGQGAKTAAELLAQAALEEGKSVQAFPDFGPERTGAPIKTYVRISSQAIRTHEPVIDPDVVVVVDETLLGIVDVCANLDENEDLIVNSTKTREDIALETGYGGSIHCIDATGLSLSVIGEPRPNSAILGKLIKISEPVSLDQITHAFRQKYIEKIGAEKTEKNIQAIEQAYYSL